MIKAHSERIQSAFRTYSERIQNVFRMPVKYIFIEMWITAVLIVLPVFNKTYRQ